MTAPSKEPKSNLLSLYIDSKLNKDNSILINKRKAFFIFDLQGQLAYANRVFEELTGYRKSEWLTMGIEELFVSTELDDKQTFFKGRIRETLGSFHTFLNGKEGMRLTVSIFYFPIYFKGEYVGTQIVLQGNS